MSHDTDDTSNYEGSFPRDVRGSDGEPSTSVANGGDVERSEVDALEAELEEELERGNPLNAVASFKGPLPPASILRGYEELVPGSAGNIINAYVGNQNASVVRQ